MSILSNYFSRLIPWASSRRRQREELDLATSLELRVEDKKWLDIFQDNVFVEISVLYCHPHYIVRKDYYIVLDGTVYMYDENGQVEDVGNSAFHLKEECRRISTQQPPCNGYRSTSRIYSPEQIYEKLEI